jgi:hypothetical protein
MALDGTGRGVSFQSEFPPTTGGLCAILVWKCFRIRWKRSQSSGRSAREVGKARTLVPVVEGAICVSFGSCESVGAVNIQA